MIFNIVVIIIIIIVNIINIVLIITIMIMFTVIMIIIRAGGSCEGGNPAGVYEFAAKVTSLQPLSS